MTNDNERLPIGNAAARIDDAVRARLALETHDDYVDARDAAVDAYVDGGYDDAARDYAVVVVDLLAHYDYDNAVDGVRPYVEISHVGVYAYDARRRTYVVYGVDDDVRDATPYDVDDVRADIARRLYAIDAAAVRDAAVSTYNYAIAALDDAYAAVGMTNDDDDERRRLDDAYDAAVEIYDDAVRRLDAALDDTTHTTTTEVK